MQVHLLVNRHSGSGKAIRVAPRVAEELQARGHQVEMAVTSNKEEGQAWTKLHAPKAERFVVFGGDGTMNAVLNSFPEKPPPTLLVPCGSSNLLGHEFKLPRKPFKVADTVESGQVYLLDTGLLNGERRSFLMWDIGYGGELMRRMEDIRKSKSGTVFRPLYYPLILKMFFDWKPSQQTVIADGQDLGEFPYVIVSGVRTYATYFLKLAPADYQDGSWELLALKKPGFWRLLGVALCGFLGGAYRSRLVHFQKVRKVEIRCQRPEQMQIDGDYAGLGPVNFEVTDFQLPLLVPADVIPKLGPNLGR